MTVSASLLQPLPRCAHLGPRRDSAWPAATAQGPRIPPFVPALPDGHEYARRCWLMIWIDRLRQRQGRIGVKPVTLALTGFEHALQFFDQAFPGPGHGSIGALGLGSGRVTR